MKLAITFLETAWNLVGSVAFRSVEEGLFLWPQGSCLWLTYFC